MSMAEQAPEPTMEEILSSIRHAINDDKPAPSAPPLGSEPLAATASPETNQAPAATAIPADPDAAREHDPFAALTRRLHETRVDVHRQMQEASTASLPASDHAPSTPPAMASAAAQASPASGFSTAAPPPAASGEDHKNEFSQIVANLSQRSTERSPAEVPPPPPRTLQPPASAPATFGQASNTALDLDDRTLMEAVLRKIIEPAIKSWLDENLTRLVTETVRDEIRKSGGLPK